MTINLTREQFYDLVWSEPMQTLGKQIGISGVAIAKHCKKAGIPVPERGYWNKLQAGKAITKVALPERDLATVNRISMTGALPPELHSHIQGEPGVAGPRKESIELLTERFRKRLGTVAVPRGFSRTHPIIATLLRKDEECRVKAQSDPYAWPKPKFDEPFERRRLRIINGLFLAFAKVGGGGWIRGADAREHAISLGDKGVSFTLDKRGRGGRRSADANDDDRLHLELTHHQPSEGFVVRWQDQDGLSLENQLTDIVVGMAIAAEHFERQWIAQRIAWELERQAEARKTLQKQRAREVRQIRRAIMAARKARSNILRRHAEEWRAASNIRDYIAALRTAASKNVEPAVFDAWALWALEEADRLDPIRAGRAVAAIHASAGTDFDMAGIDDE